MPNFTLLLAVPDMALVLAVLSFILAGYISFLIRNIHTRLDRIEKYLRLEKEKADGNVRKAPGK